MQILVIVPTYNECDNIQQLLPDLLALPGDLHILVVDDNSPDGTGQWVDNMALTQARVKAVHRAGKMGLGTAYIAGFRYALAHQFDAVLTMDADFSHQPKYIPDLVARIETADMVIGSRYVPGGRAVDSPFLRRLLSWGANLGARLALGLHAHDCTAGFRCYRRQVLESLDLATIFADGYSFLIEMTFLVQRAGWRVAETPIQFIDRRQGTSKVSRTEIYKALYTVARLSLRRIRQTLSGTTQV